MKKIEKVNLGVHQIAHPENIDVIIKSFEKIASGSATKFDIDAVRMFLTQVKNEAPIIESATRFAEANYNKWAIYATLNRHGLTQ